jgi:glycosyltransferase involved in cell wall biosynthesis
MSERHLHIISFDIPYPANYGGVIDVFYKIRALHAAGVRIHLHCFEYHRIPAPELNKYCFETVYYPRRTGLLSLLSRKPYIVYSRRSDLLLRNLCRDNYPILFEGLHSCYYLNAKELRNRFRIYRESNIEHHYYFHLSKAEKNIFRKAFFIFSGVKLMAYQSVLGHASLMLTVSKEDHDYLKGRFPENRIEYLPSFHRDDDVKILPGKGNYALYQGKLSVVENRKAVEYLVTKVFRDLDTKFIVAGGDPPEKMRKLIARYPNITLIANPTDSGMCSLINNAQVNIMVTFQSTGLKLKLLNALFNGRFCLVNQEMVTGTELGELCEIAENAAALRARIDYLMDRPFTESMINERRIHLLKWHSNTENCKTLLGLLPLC